MSRNDTGERRELSPAWRCTGWQSKSEGTWGSLVNHQLQPTFLERAATSSQPPEIRPHILLFGTTSSGTSTATRSTSPTRPSASEKEERSSLVNRDKISLSDKLSVRKVVETIESIEDHKQEEAKKKENEKKESRKLR